MILEIKHKDSLEELVFKSNKQLVFLYLWADSSKISKSALPKVSEIGEDLEDKAIIGLVNAEQHNNIHLKYDIKHIPTLIAFIDEKPAEILSGLALTNSERIIRFIEHVDKKY